jgi:hypothetical protein
MKLKGKMYDYLGHFRQEKFLREGHNTMAEPAATQEFVRERFGRKRRDPYGRTDEERKAYKQDRDDLKRIAGEDAKEFRKTVKGAGISHYDRYLDWKSRNPEGSPEDWARIQEAKSRGER